MTGKKFTLVQALRGFAALWVVLFHASEGGHIPGVKAGLPGWLSSVMFDAGHFGVAVFFALSGFVIAHSIRGDTITASYFGRFVLRRSIRLDPPYWTAIILSVAFAGLSARAKHIPMLVPSAGQVLAHVTYTQELLRFPEINNVFWTLTYEVQFYVVFVFGMLLSKRLRVPAEVVLCAPLPFTVAAWMGHGVPGLFTNLWPCFLVGGLGYWGMSSRKHMMATVALAVAVLVVHPSPFEAISMSVGIGLMLAGRFNLLETLSWRPVQFIGTISYSLYLTHNPVTGATFFVLSEAHTPEPAALAVALCICIAIAALFWALFERPAIRLAYRIKLRNSGSKR